VWLSDGLTSVQVERTVLKATADQG
jgi:hypothetical protein